MKRIGVLTPFDKYKEYTPPECILSPLWNYKIAGKNKKKDRKNTYINETKELQI